MEEKQKNLGFGLISIIVAVAIIAILVSAGWYWKKTQLQKLQMPPARQTDQPDISDWKTYRNEKYGFEVRYPSDYFIFVQPQEITLFNACYAETQGCRPFLAVSDRPVTARDKEMSEYLLMFPDMPNYVRDNFFYYLRKKTELERMSVEIIADEISSTFKFTQ